MESRPLFSQPSYKAPLKLSIEVFPPAVPAGIEGLAGSVARMMRLEPAFVSVTYGAGGSTRARSLAVVERLLAETNGRTAAHVTCIASPRRDIDRAIEDFIAAGVQRFVALRGDCPADGVASNGYADAIELVEALSRRGIDDISVAAYPEVHPKAASAEADLDVLKAKCDAGAKRAITQFFLDNSAFHGFRDIVERQHLGVPVVPGVLLFEDFGRAASFARRCGTRVPDHLARRFQRHEACPAALRAETRSFLAEQIADLIAAGVGHIHLYTLNRPDLALELFGSRPALPSRPASALSAVA